VDYIFELRSKKMQQEQIIKVISEAAKVDPSQIKMETSFVDDLKFDSLDIVELMMKMEDDFGVEIPEEDAEGLKTVGDVIKYIGNKKN
jgi:acyl carrier protein